MKNVEISFVIIEYHSADDIKRCVSSINDNCRDISCEIIVSSNSLYPRDIQDDLRREFPGIIWIFNRDNYGFARAANIGMSNAAGDCIVLMNSDAVIKDGSLRSAYRYLMAHKDVGLIGPKIVDKLGHVQDSSRNFMTPKRFLRRMLKRVFFRNDVLLRSDFDYERTQSVDWVVGAFMMAKLQAIENVGLLDDRYFLYVEDMDWCRRFWDAGYKVVHYADLTVEYKADKKSIAPIISRGLINRYSLHHLKSYLRFLRKHGIRVNRQ